MTTRARAAATRRTAGTAAWGELTDDEHAGHTIAWAWPWDEDAEGSFVRRVGLGGFDEDGTELVVHVIDYGGEIGEQPTQRRADAEVTLP